MVDQKEEDGFYFGILESKSSQKLKDQNLKCSFWKNLDYEVSDSKVLDSEISYSEELKYEVTRQHQKLVYCHFQSYKSSLPSSDHV
jgi:hypothetical protein